MRGLLGRWMCVLLIAALWMGVAAACGNAQAIHYDAAVDFDKDFNPARVTMFQGVPVWSYGSRPADSLFTTMFQTNLYPGLGFNLPGMYAWFLSTGIVINRTGSDYQNAGATFRADRIWVHPGFSGEYALIRWTAPAGGTINIAAEVVCRNPNQSADGVDAHVLVNGIEQWGMLLHYSDDKSFSANGIAVNGGDVVDFALGAGSNRNYISDHTEVNASVDFTPGSVVPVSSISISPGSPTGGRLATGTVTLAAASPGGQTAYVTGNNPALIPWPILVRIPAGSNKGTFTARSNPVSAKTTVTVSATSGGVTKSKSVSVIPPVVLSVTITPDSVVGGDSTTGVVILNAPAPVGGLAVQLSSNSLLATVPSSVTVPAGTVSASFSVETLSVLSTSTATISAKVIGSTVTKTDALTIQP